MAKDRCEIFDVRRNGKLRWKWRATAESGAIEGAKDEYELFYDCLSAARKKGLTPTYAGQRLFEQGDPLGPLHRAPPQQKS